MVAPYDNLPCASEVTAHIAAINERRWYTLL
jgi:hypothetical protein